MLHRAMRNCPCARTAARPFALQPRLSLRSGAPRHPIRCGAVGTVDACADCSGAFGISKDSVYLRSLLTSKFAVTPVAGQCGLEPVMRRATVPVPKQKNTS